MDYINRSLEESLIWLKENLNEERYEHSLGCADCARNLARKYNLNEEKAYIAGLLHDCAKCFSYEKSVEILNQTNLKVEEVELNNRKTLHAPVSACIAKNTFGVTDEEILSAIRWHTLGKIGMTDFEKIIFLSDKIEERTREYEHAQPIRNCLLEQNGLNKAILQCYKQTIKSLVDRNLTIHPLTIDIYNDLQVLLSLNKV